MINVEKINAKKGITWIAQCGLSAKGFVYVLLGVIAFMATFHIKGQSSENADTSGALNFLNTSFAGQWLMPLLAIGLLCYTIWRFIEAARAAKGADKKWKKAGRYFLSGLVYLSVSFTAFRIVMKKSTNNGDSQQQFAAELLSKPYGQWLLGIVALLIAAIGVYQVYYGLSEKYKKHVQKMNLNKNSSSLMLGAGKIGYVARGVVWAIISYLMLQAALMASSEKAGDTGKAFGAIDNTLVGAYLPAALGIGLIAYGVFNFVRARYERFE